MSIRVATRSELRVMVSVFRGINLVMATDDRLMMGVFGNIFMSFYNVLSPLFSLM
jgi:hypothetical protein